MPAADLLAALDACPEGIAGWTQFEDIGTDILSYLLVPPLNAPYRQPRSFSGIDRRDAIFPNRVVNPETVWGRLLQDHRARMVLVEFKNYAGEIGKDEVDQTRSYLTNTIGKLALLCCRRPPGKHALLRRNQVYTQDSKVILFLTEAHLREMIYMKERGEDPSLFIMSLVELFYMEHE